MIKIYAVKTENNLKSQRKDTEKLLKHIFKDGYSIGKTTAGKPYLTDRTDVHFNISHSRNYAVCAVSDRPVGIDIEFIREIDIRVIKRFLKNCTPENAVSEWTKRESFGKMTGIGIGDDRYDEIPHIFREYRDIENYIITVCADNSETGGSIVTTADFPEKIILYDKYENGAER